MKSRILRDAGIVAAVPFVSILMITKYWDNLYLRLYLILACIIFHFIAIMFSMWDVHRLFRPSAKVLVSMGVGRMPAAYEPGKFKLDYLVSGILVFFSILAPIFVCIGKYDTVTFTIPFSMARTASYAAPNFIWVWLTVAAILIGPLALCFWAKAGQAMVIANEGGEGKRYLYRAFAEEVENKDRMYHYLSLSGRFPAL